MKIRMTVIAGLAVFALLLGAQRSQAQGTAGPGALPQTAMPSAIRVPAAAQPSDHFDVEAATDAYLAEIPANARAKSDAYFEGGYWLILWDFLYGVALYILLLHFGWSAGMRNLAERITRFKPLQTFIYWAEFLVLTTILSAPLAVYEGFVRERKYGLATQTFGPWLGDQFKILLVNIVLLGILAVLLVGVVRRWPRSWSIRCGVVSIIFMIFGVMIAPVFIFPILNKFTVLDDPRITQPILSLARANGIPAQKIYQMDASRQTTRMSANVSGFGQTMRITLNDNLLRRGSPEEIQSVMGHEMGHYVLHHIAKDLLFFSVLIVIFFVFLRWSLDWSLNRWGARWQVRGIGDTAVLPLVFLAGYLFGFVTTPFFNTHIRTNEFEADMYGLNASRQPDGFAQAAIHLGEYRKMSPGQVEEWIFFDHPSGRNRIRAAMLWKVENLQLFVSKADHQLGSSLTSAPSGVSSRGHELRVHMRGAKSVRISVMAATAIPIDTLPSINPATGAVVGQFEKTAPSLIPEIISCARATQTEWAKVPIRERCAKLRVLGECIMASRDDLADAVVRESGKPRVEALFADLFVALDSAKYWSEHAAALLRTQRVPHHSTAAKAKSGYLLFEPLGVIAIISSWNYPLAIPLSQIVPAVAAGNAVVCKTSDFTPQCGALIEQLFLDAGFPKQLVTIVQGGGEVGQALIEAAPDKVLFTGSVATGRRVAESCAKKLVPSVLELGGKDAMIVLADANLDVAASAAVWGSYTNCGQVCLSVERLFVEESVSETFAALCVAKTKKLRLGSGSDPSTDVGPLIRPQHVQRMNDLIRDAVSRGARVLCGGHPRPDLGPNFFEPTVIAGVDSSMKLFQEETFGPILALQSVRDPESAIARANDSPFALSASVWTGDTRRGEAIAKRLRAGAVMVNDAISYFAIAEAPHGGCGASGWGRTHGRAGLLEMVQTKYIDVDRLPRREKPWWYRYGADLERAADAFLRFEFSAGIAAKLGNARSALKTFFRDHGL